MKHITVYLTNEFRLLFLLLMLHPAVLEPDLDLSLGQLEHAGHLDAARAAQVAVEEELLLQLHQLCARVRRPGALRASGQRLGLRGVLCNTIKGCRKQ